MRFQNSNRPLPVVMALAIGILSAMPAAALPDRSIGAVMASGASPWRGPADLPLDQMVGRKLVFLEKAPQEQATGYPAFRILAAGQEPGGEIPAYRAFVGKMVRIDAVQAAAAGEYLVTVTAVDDGTQLQARTMARAIADVAPVGDLYRARHRWLGKTIFPRKRSVQTYDPATCRYGELPVRVNEPLKVVDVIWGMSATKPLWIVVQRDNGERGFIATAYSWTNLYSDWWSAERPWEDKIVETTANQEMVAMGVTGRPSRMGGQGAGRNEDNPF
jgi:hypothetical protein